ncbi:MAG TPA: hypothetical protein VFA24_08250 [Gaiellaceae bacterium]|nr:hypothetical protein [Gaiellaceae bacterium]
MVDAVVTHHRDSFRSGVGRFNELLAERLGVPVIGIRKLLTAGHERPLLSFKVAELAPAELAVLERLVEQKPFDWELFLHVYDGDELEERLVRGAAHVHAGNHEVYEQVRGLARSADTLWSPGLILDERPFPDADVSVFSFGMAHKIRTDLFLRLRELLEATGRTYAVYLSAANHETTRMRDAHLIFDELHEIFPSTLYFLGNLSDVGVYNYLRSSTFFATFFLGGVRANNGSVAAAMEKGAVVITNLDERSPPEFVHMDNLIDIGQTRELPLDPARLEALSRRARETARERGWEALVERIRS